MIIDRIWKKLERDHSRRLFISSVRCKGAVSIHGHVEVNATDVAAGCGLSVYPGAYFWGDGPIRIGNNVDIGKDTILYAHKGGGITIGDNVAIAAQCYIIDSDHGLSANTLIREQPMSTAPIVIEDDVWIGANAVILPGVRIENH